MLWQQTSYMISIFIFSMDAFFNQLVGNISFVKLKHTKIIKPEDKFA